MIEEFQSKLSEEKLEFKFRNSEYNKYFKSINALREFFKKESDFWKEFNNGQIINTRNKYSNFNSFIITLYKQLENKTTNITNAFRDYKTKLNQFNQNPQYNFYSRDNIAKRLKWLYINKDQHHANGYWKFLTNSQINSSNKGELFGAIDAYRMTNKWVDNDEVENLQQEIDVAISGYSKKIDELDSKYESMFTENKDSYDNMLKESEDFKSKIEVELNEYLSTEKDNLEQIKKHYTESLRLKGPAKYWKDLEDDYNSRGKKWMYWAVGFTLILLIYLTIVLYNLPHLLNVSIDLYNLNSLRGTIIFTLIVSMAIYMIRLFVKLSLSAYHLARDSRERYQLSHVYLSLINDSAIPEEDRKIVLQSLFSRADSGLLKGDSSPTFPDSITKHLFNINKPM